MGWKVSVGRRINMLVLFQSATMVLIICMAAYAMKQLVMDASHMYRFQLLSVGDIADHLEKAAELQRIVHPGTVKPLLSEDEEIEELHRDLRKFDQRYRSVWNAEHNDGADNQLFVSDLKNAGKLSLLDEEKAAFEEFESSLAEMETHFVNGKVKKSREHWDSVVRVRESLASLLELNMEFAETSNTQIANRAQSTRNLQIMIGILSLFATLFMGILVHRAIAPRIGRLVSKVSRFKEFGVNEKVIEDGRDEITILANAIDAGFAAIVEREKERDQFLAIAAHELKTPITSIQGFSSLLMDERTPAETKARALDIISKQSWRLSRLIEGLFLMMRARSGNLKFNPAPLNLTSLTQKLLQEVKPFLPTQTFSFKNSMPVNILGDELLLGHALWSLFTCTSAFSANNAIVNVNLENQGSHLLLEIHIDGKPLPQEEIEALFTPFHTVEYETGVAARGTIGLYLTREIFRVHHGRLFARNESTGTVFCVELPA